MKELRIIQQLNQNKLATKLNVHQVDVSYWENGKRTPPIELLPDLAKILKCTVDELVDKLIKAKERCKKEKQTK